MIVKVSLILKFILYDTPIYIWFFEICCVCFITVLSTTAVAKCPSLYSFSVGKSCHVQCGGQAAMLCVVIKAAMLCVVIKLPCCVW
jgi:hypothetical protein